LARKNKTVFHSNEESVARLMAMTFASMFVFMLFVRFS